MIKEATASADKTWCIASFFNSIKSKLQHGYSGVIITSKGVFYDNNKSLYDRKK